MPSSLTYPGLYIEETPSPVRTIVAVPTAVAGFVGRAKRGPVNVPIRIHNFTDFERSFGGLWNQSELGYAVQQYFLNGGADAYIVRTAQAATLSAPPVTYKLATPTGNLFLSAKTPGTWSKDLFFTVDYNTRIPLQADEFIDISRTTPFARQSMTEDDVTDLTPGARQAALKRFRTLRHDGLFAPPSRQGTVVLPGFDGGGEWGGAAVDREAGVIYVNGSDVPWIAAMREVAPVAPHAGAPRTGEQVYATACAGCHGLDRRGNDRAPSLLGIGGRLSPTQLYEVINRGRGFMPSWTSARRGTCVTCSLVLGSTSPPPTAAPLTAAIVGLLIGWAV